MPANLRADTVNVQINCTSNQISDSNRINNTVFLIDLKSQMFCYVNDYACKTLGYSRDELLQMGVLDIDLLMDDASLQKIVEQMTGQGFSLLETYPLTKEGRLFPKVNILGFLWLVI